MAVLLRGIPGSLLFESGMPQILRGAFRTCKKNLHSLCGPILPSSGVMFLAVTVVLAAVVVGIGVLAAFAIQEMRDHLDERVSEAIDGKLSDRALSERIARFIRKWQNQRSLNCKKDLTEGFDPEDTANR